MSFVAREIQNAQTLEKSAIVYAESSQQVKGSQAFFFTSIGGISNHITKTENGDPKLTGAFGSVGHAPCEGESSLKGNGGQGLNVGMTTGDDKKNVEENIARISEILGYQKKPIIFLRSGYGDNIHLVTSSSTQDKSITSTENKLAYFMDGDAIITRDPNIAIACVGADAHPIAIRGTDREGNPVIALVVGSHHGLMQGVLAKTLQKMQAELNVAPEALFVEVGPGLGPTSLGIKFDERGQHGVTGTAYEVGVDIPLKLLLKGDDTILSLCSNELHETLSHHLTNIHLLRPILLALTANNEHLGTNIIPQEQSGAYQSILAEIQHLPSAKEKRAFLEKSESFSDLVSKIADALRESSPVAGLENPSGNILMPPVFKKHPTKPASHTALDILELVKGISITSGIPESHIACLAESKGIGTLADTYSLESPFYGARRAMKEVDPGYQEKLKNERPNERLPNIGPHTAVGRNCYVLSIGS